jgi:hypothetical protein
MSAPELLPCPFCGDPMERWGGDTVRHTDFDVKCPIVGQGFMVLQWNRRADLAAAKEIRIAELERQLAEAREVKPLEWKPWPLGTSQAESVFGTYHTWPGHWRAPDATGRKADNPEAAAQADYTARSLSALKEPKPRFTEWPEEDFDITVGERKEPKP